MILWLFPLLTWASETKSVQPYIDELKRGLPAEGTSSSVPSRGSYTEDLKIKLKAKQPASSGGSYTEELKRKDPELYKKDPGSSYSETQKTKLGEKKLGGAIAAVRDGRSELHAKIEGDVHFAAGFRVGVGASNQVTGSLGATNGSFENFYGKGWFPDLNFFAEYQPFHTAWAGNLGIFAGTGFTYHSGSGVFKIQLANPFDPSGTPFSQTSHTQLKFFTLPIVAGLNYRFSLSKNQRPYVQAAPTLVFYEESRSDAKSANLGKSIGYELSGGLNILLDNIAKGISWDLYDEFGIKHYYLTLDYTKLSTITGSVHFDASTTSLGFTYEF